MGTAARRLRLASVISLALLLVVAQDALALTWGPRIAVTTSRNATAGTHAFASSGSTAHLVYEDAAGGIRRIWYRRSTDGAATWGAPVQLSADAALLASAGTIAIGGSMVDVAWLEELEAGNWVVRYRRSTNGGAAWGPEVTLSQTDSGAGIVRLARDAAGRVFAIWTNDLTGSIRLRRSTDGGATWNPAVGLGTTTNELSVSPYLDGWPVVATGTGVVYVGFASSATTIKLRRSTNGGSTWGAATTIAGNNSGLSLDVAASGSLVVVGFAKYRNGHLFTSIRRSKDKGATWKTAQALAPTTGAWSWQPVLAVNGTTVRVLYERLTDLSGTKSHVWYRQSSSSGATWSAATKVSNTSRPYSGPVGLGVASSPVAVWFDWAPAVLDSDVYVRRGS